MAEDVLQIPSASDHILEDAVLRRYARKIRITHCPMYVVVAEMERDGVSPCDINRFKDAFADQRDPFAAMPDDGSDPWPNLSAIAAAVKLRGSGPRAVLLTTGAMNPVHHGHVAMMNSAKEVLQQEHGITVLAGFISPSHDMYVGPKANRSDAFHASAAQRVDMCWLATQDHSSLHVATWECREEGYLPDYPVVLAQLEKQVHAISGAEEVLVLYVCGTDHARYCEHGFPGIRNAGLVVIARDND